METEVELYVGQLTKFRSELFYLRDLLLECGLSETLKWGAPIYMYNDVNVILLGAYKDNCVLSFIKGALIKDETGLLVKPGPNTQAARVFRFTNLLEIQKLRALIKAYIFQAIEIEKQGLKVAYKVAEEFEIPSELSAKFEQMPELKEAFERLTPGRRTGYLLHFSAAKQSKTKVSRIEACVPKIMAGKGFLDCDCGLSKNLPRCDGSHKQLRNTD